MQMPNVTSTLRDAKQNVTYRVLAYRALSEAELVRAVGMYHAQPRIRRLKKPFKNKAITIVTIIGATDRL